MASPCCNFFGYATPDNEKFDPVKHFNMACCTVTIDTQATNETTQNFPAFS